MLFSKLKAMSIGTMWALRNQETSSSCCSVCGKPWMQPALEEQSVLAILADPVIDEAQQKLLVNCLKAAGWYAHTTCFFLHSACASNGQTILQTHIATQVPQLMIVFDHKSLPPELVLDENTRLIATYHPQEMLANPTLKAQVWADFCSANFC